MTTGATTDTAAQVLRSTSIEALLRAAYSLTHQIHECRGNVRAKVCDGPCTDLREQRNLIDAEIVRRTTKGA